MPKYDLCWATNFYTSFSDLDWILNLGVKWRAWNACHTCCDWLSFKRPQNDRKRQVVYLQRSEVWSHEYDNSLSRPSPPCIFSFFSFNAFSVGLFFFCSATWFKGSSAISLAFERLLLSCVKCLDCQRTKEQYFQLKNDQKGMKCVNVCLNPCGVKWTNGKVGDWDCVWICHVTTGLGWSYPSSCDLLNKCEWTCKVICICWCLVLQICCWTCVSRGQSFCDHFSFI